MWRPALAILAGLMVLVAGCAQTAAPVVDKPVADWSMPKQPPAPSAPAPSRPAAAGGSRDVAARSAPPPGAEPDWRPDVYVVKRGDTLYAIALDHGQSYRDVAAWNGLSDPNVIRVGQTLRVRPPAGWADPADAADQAIAQPMPAPPATEAEALEAPAPPPVKTGPKAVKLPYSERALAQVRGVPYKEPVSTAQSTAPKPAGAAPAPPAGSAASKPATPAQPARVESAKAEPTKPVTGVASTVPARPADPAKGWAWPARGPLVHGFNSGANPKGIAIAGEAGQPVLAAAPGKVVYSGSGLRGYGKLVIIKHDDTYLSVYAHNRELLVKEGQRVAQGQMIAEMGATDADRVALHFEIRRLGRPVDPLQFLPDAGS